MFKTGREILLAGFYVITVKEPKSAVFEMIALKQGKTVYHYYHY